jgi:hypothetical protein
MPAPPDRVCIHIEMGLCDALADSVGLPVIMFGLAEHSPPVPVGIVQILPS